MLSTLVLSNENRLLIMRGSPHLYRWGEDVTILTAEEGKVFKNTITGDILTNQIYLGCNDRADNYTEINEEDAIKRYVALIQ